MSKKTTQQQYEEFHVAVENLKASVGEAFAPLLPLLRKHPWLAPWTLYLCVAFVFALSVWATLAGDPISGMGLALLGLYALWRVRRTQP
jgi:hypothetical protein